MFKKWLKHLIWKDITQNPEYPEVNVPCPEITIEQVDQTLYDSLLAEATAAGMTFDGDKASIEGCDFTWSYDAPSQTLRAQCIKKPILVGCGFIAEKIQTLVTKARTGL